MAAPEHRLEARAKRLSVMMQDRVEALRMAVAPPGQRVPFTKQLSSREALRWWTQHRNDGLGQRVIDSWPDDKRSQWQMELDAALTNQNAAVQSLGAPMDGPFAQAFQQMQARQNGSVRAPDEGVE